MVRQRQHRSQKQLLHHDDTGFQKLESFFSGIFGCGRDCHQFARGDDNGSTTTATATVATTRSSSDSHGSNCLHIFSLEAEFNLGYPHGKPTDHGDSNHHHNTNESYSSILDETATTQLDSFLLDDSISSSSTNGSFLLSQAQHQNQQHVGNRQASILQRRTEPIMIPTETVVGTWPPLPQSHCGKLRMTQQQQQAWLTQERHGQQEIEQQRHGQGQQQTKKAPTEHENGDPPIPFPIRPPKIRRLTLDDALSSSLTMGRDTEKLAGFPLVCPNDLLPTFEKGSLQHAPCNFYDCYDDLTTAKQTTPYSLQNTKEVSTKNPYDFVNSTAMYRSRSLEFLRSSSRNPN